MSTDLSRAESIEIKVRPNASWYSIVAIMPGAREHTVLTTKDWSEAQHLQQRLTVELIVGGKNMKIDEETGRLVVDYD